MTWREIPFWIRGLAILGITMAALTVLGYSRFQESAMASNERAASAALKMLTSGQADFRGNDRDGNRIQDFWTGDVAGLYGLLVAGLPLDLIDKAIAAADTSSGVKGAVPYHGYYFRVMLTDEEGNPYQTDTKGPGSGGRKLWNHSKFAFSAYPARYGVSGRHTFNVNEWNTVFKEDLGGKPRLVWPKEKDLKFEYGPLGE